MKQLEVRGLTVRFGSVTAVDDLGFSVDQGSLVGLIGSNGAGKTTTLDALTGFVPASGSALFEGEELLGLPAHRRAAAGISRTWQSVELFDDLTVFENLCVASSASNFGSVLRSMFAGRGAVKRDVVNSLIDDFDIADVAERYPTELSEGQRKLVGLARTLATRPRLLLADEPAAGLDSRESLLLGHRLRSLADLGLTILLIDHDMGMVLEVCDQVIVLDHGLLIATGSPDEIRCDQAVLGAYLGSAAEMS